VRKKKRDRNEIISIASTPIALLGKVLGVD